jgi:hypothetical protein
MHTGNVREGYRKERKCQKRILDLREFAKKKLEYFFLEFGELPIADSEYLECLIVDDLHGISDDTLGDIVVE